MNTYVPLWNCLFQFFLELVSDKSSTGNQKRTFYVQQCLSQNGAVCDLMWKKCGRARHATDDNITRCMRFACWITEATDTHTQNMYTYCFSTTKIVTRTRLSVTLYIYSLSSCTLISGALIFNMHQHFFPQKSRTKTFNILAIIFF